MGPLLDSPSAIVNITSALTPTVSTPESTRSFRGPSYGSDSPRGRMESGMPPASPAAGALPLLVVDDAEEEAVVGARWRRGGG